MTTLDRTAAARDRARLLVDALRIVRRRFQQIIDRPSRDDHEGATSVAPSPNAQDFQSARRRFEQLDERPDRAAADERDGPTSVAPSTGAPVFARGDDALGVARVELDAMDRPESLEIALALIADVLESTRGVVATARAALTEATPKVRVALEHEETRLGQLQGALDELSVRARFVVGQEVYRRATAVVEPKRLDILFLRALRADRPLDELLSDPNLDEDGRIAARLVFEHVVARLRAELDAEHPERPRVTRTLPKGPLVLKLAYPDPVDVGDPFTLVLRVRNDAVHPVSLAAVDLDLGLTRAIELRTVHPTPSASWDSDDVTTFAIERELASLETIEITFTGVARQPGSVESEVSVWTDDAQIALGVVSLDVLLRQ